MEGWTWKALCNEAPFWVREESRLQRDLNPWPHDPKSGALTPRPRGRFPRKTCGRAEDWSRNLLNNSQIAYLTDLEGLAPKDADRMANSVDSCQDLSVWKPRIITVPYIINT